MAAWGTKTFEDDTSVDWLEELTDSEETRNFLLGAITLTAEDDLDYDTGAIAVAASEVIVALLDEPRKGLPEDLRDWLSANECDDITDLPEFALNALNLVLAEGSEFKDTWTEVEDYSDWREGVDELLEIMGQLVDA